MRVLILITLHFFLANSVFGQKYSGLILNKKTLLPIEYVNIGIAGKGIGTVSNNNGKYVLILDAEFENDTLLVSCIGYYPFSIKVSEFKKLKTQTIYLDEKIFSLKEVVIHPKIYKERILGITSKSKSFTAGFKENKLGYEFGILIKVKKSTIIEKVNINIALCTYDTILYRLNIYKVVGRMNFENILQKPIYIKLSKDQINEKVIIDLESYNLEVNGDFLITIEHIKDLGPGELMFCGSLLDKTYYRLTSQGNWYTIPMGISISLIAKVEK
jgi:hypothetical protein